VTVGGRSFLYRDIDRDKSTVTEVTRRIGRHRGKLPQKKLHVEYEGVWPSIGVRNSKLGSAWCSATSSQVVTSAVVEGMIVIFVHYINRATRRCPAFFQSRLERVSSGSGRVG